MKIDRRYSPQDLEFNLSCGVLWHVVPWRNQYEPSLKHKENALSLAPYSEKSGFAALHSTVVQED